MGILVACPRCDARLTFESIRPHSSVRCSMCRALFTITPQSIISQDESASDEEIPLAESLPDQDDGLIMDLDEVPPPVAPVHPKKRKTGSPAPTKSGGIPWNSLTKDEAKKQSKRAPANVDDDEDDFISVHDDDDDDRPQKKPNKKPSKKSKGEPNKKPSISPALVGGLILGLFAVLGGGGFLAMKVFMGTPDPKPVAVNKPVVTPPINPVMPFTPVVTPQQNETPVTPVEPAKKIDKTPRITPKIDPRPMPNPFVPMPMQNPFVPVPMPMPNPFVPVPMPIPPIGPVADANTLTPAIPAAVQWTPIELGGGSQSIPFGTKMGQVAIGGGGRYVVMGSEAGDKIAILDLTTQKLTPVAMQRPMVDPQLKLTAGMTQVYGIGPKIPVMFRYELATARMQGFMQLGIYQPVQQIAVGSASSGPLLVIGANNSGFMDVTSTRPIVAPALPNPILDGYVAGSTYSASSNGRTFLRYHPKETTATVLHLDAGKATQAKKSDFTEFPSLYPDGKGLVTRSGRVELNLKYEPSPFEDVNLVQVPSMHGKFIVRAQLGGEKKGTVEIFLDGGDFPVATLEKVPLWEPTDTTLSPAQRIMFLPDARLLMVIPQSRDRVELRTLKLN